MKSEINADPYSHLTNAYHNPNKRARSDMEFGQTPMLCSSEPRSAGADGIERSLYLSFIPSACRIPTLAQLGAIHA